jgi:hypothetical protein
MDHSGMCGRTEVHVSVEDFGIKVACRAQAVDSIRVEGFPCTRILEVFGRIISVR